MKLTGRRDDQTTLEMVSCHALGSRTRAAPEWFMLALGGPLTVLLCFLPLTSAPAHIAFVVLCMGASVLCALVHWFMQSRHRPHTARSEERNGPSVLTACDGQGTDAHSPAIATNGVCSPTNHISNSHSGGRRRCGLGSSRLWPDVIPVLELLLLGLLILLFPHVVTPVAVSPHGTRDVHAPSEWKYPLEGVWKVCFLHLWLAFAVNMRLIAWFAVACAHFTVLLGHYNKLSTVVIALALVWFLTPLVCLVVIAVLYRWECPERDECCSFVARASGGAVPCCGSTELGRAGVGATIAQPRCIAVPPFVSVANMDREPCGEPKVTRGLPSSLSGEAGLSPQDTHKLRACEGDVFFSDNLCPPFLLVSVSGGCVVGASDSFAKCIGFTVGELVGEKFEHLLAALNVECGAELLGIMQSLVAEAVPPTRGYNEVICSQENASHEVGGAVSERRASNSASPLHCSRGVGVALGECGECADRAEELCDPRTGGCIWHRVLLRGCKLRRSPKATRAFGDTGLLSACDCGVANSFRSDRDEVNDQSAPAGSAQEVVLSGSSFSFVVDVWVDRTLRSGEGCVVIRQPLLYWLVDHVPLPCFLVHPETGCVLHWTGAAEECTGQTAYNMVGSPVCVTSPTASAEGRLVERVGGDAECEELLNHCGTGFSALLHVPQDCQPFVVTLRQVHGKYTEVESRLPAGNVVGLVWPPRLPSCTAGVHFRGGRMAPVSEVGSSSTVRRGLEGTATLPCVPSTDGKETCMDGRASKSNCPVGWLSGLLNIPQRCSGVWPAEGVPFLCVIERRSSGRTMTAWSAGLATACQNGREPSSERGEGLVHLAKFSRDVKQSPGGGGLTDARHNIAVSGRLRELIAPSVASPLRQLGEALGSTLQETAGCNNGQDQPTSTSEGDEAGCCVTPGHPAPTAGLTSGGPESGEEYGGAAAEPVTIQPSGQTVPGTDDYVSTLAPRRSAMTRAGACAASGISGAVEELDGKNTKIFAEGMCYRDVPLVSELGSDGPLHIGAKAPLVDGSQPCSFPSDVPSLLSPMPERHTTEMNGSRTPSNGGVITIEDQKVRPLGVGPVGLTASSVQEQCLSDWSLKSPWGNNPSSSTRAEQCLVPDGGFAGPPGGCNGGGTEEPPIWAMLKSYDETTIPSFCIRVGPGEPFLFGRSSKCHATTTDTYVSSVQFSILYKSEAQEMNGAIKVSYLQDYRSEGRAEGVHSASPTSASHLCSEVLAGRKVRLRDNSVNGTYVNVKRVGRGRTCVLHDQDLITFRMGSSRFFLGFKFLLTDIRGVPLNATPATSISSRPTVAPGSSATSRRGTPHFYQCVSESVGTVSRGGSASEVSVPNRLSSDLGRRIAGGGHSGGGVESSRRGGTPITRRSRGRRCSTGAHSREVIEWKIGEEMLGKGGNAEVFLGMNLTNGKLIAVKRVPLPRVAMGDGGGRDVQQQYRCLQEEIKVLSKAVHPNIVQYYGSSQNDSYFNILLEFVPGGSLRHLLDNFGVLSPVVICSYLGQTLEGLFYLHKNNIVHSDLKAANILITDRGRVKLSDFGTARLLNRQRGHSQECQDVRMPPGNSADSGALLTLHVAGTLRWMAPELLRDSCGPTVASDIWSVGCVLIEMLSGEGPWYEYDFESEEELINLLMYTSEPPEVPECQTLPELTTIAKKCLTLVPEERPTCEQLLRYVRHAKEQLELVWEDLV
ncbi:FHA domain [Trypanosoma vivax]|nr:FHA domain [Trypanosoma vivax]